MPPANWDALLADPESPLSDRATKELFAPGSTFKTVVTATALDTGEADPGHRVPRSHSMYELEGSSAHHLQLRRRGLRTTVTP